jgi:predicted AlkP superfamily pyrophosphatase or phosphodiesterase
MIQEDILISESRFKTCIIINIDGCRRDLLYSLMDSGRMPALNKYMGKGLRFTSAETVFPTTTFATQASGLTGAYPARHGVVSNMWMDRTGDKAKVYDYTGNFFDAASVYRYNLIGFPTLFFVDNVKTGLADSHLSPEVKTIYEAAAEKGLTSVTAFHQFEKGASRRVRPRPSDMIRYFFANYFPHQFEVFDESMTHRLLEDFRKNGVPDINFIYFATSDGTDHWQGEKGQEQYLAEVIDKKIGRILDYICSKREPDSTLYALYGDHGHSNVKDDKEHCITIKWLSSVIGKIPGFKRVSNHTSNRKDALIALEGGMAGIYLKCPGSGRWDKLPDEDICKTVARQFLESNGGRIAAAAYRTGSSLSYELLTGSNILTPDPASIINKINREYRHINAPDVMLFSSYDEGWHFYKQPIKATHGNINSGDLEIPIIFAGKGIKKGIDDNPASIVDVAPTVASLLGFEMNRIDGKVLNIED